VKEGLFYDKNKHKIGKKMSKKNIKSYSNEYKFKVSLEMIKGDLTIAEIISKYQVPRSVLSRWKKQLLDNGAAIFKTSNSGSDLSGVDAGVIEKLHATIGKLKVENDFLVLASAKLKY
jgi:transposase